MIKNIISHLYLDSFQIINNMENNVRQRVIAFLKAKRISVNALSKEVNLKQNTLNGQLNGTAPLSFITISALITQYPELSAEWLLRGEGQMEKTDSPADLELQAVCVNQAKEIYRLKQRIAELEEPKKEHA